MHPRNTNEVFATYDFTTCLLRITAKGLGPVAGRIEMMSAPSGTGLTFIVLSEGVTADGTSIRWELSREFWIDDFNDFPQNSWVWLKGPQTLTRGKIKWIVTSTPPLPQFANPPRTGSTPPEPVKLTIPVDEELAIKTTIRHQVGYQAQIAFGKSRLELLDASIKEGVLTWYLRSRNNGNSWATVSASNGPIRYNFKFVAAASGAS